MCAERYRHFKGNEYTVLCHARHSETNEELVVYTDNKDNIWARPKEMFSETVKLNDKIVPRFELVSD